MMIFFMGFDFLNEFISENMITMMCVKQIRRYMILILSFLSYFVWMLIQAQAVESSKNTILVLGDSLSAAYQMDEKEGWVALLQNKITTENLDWSIKNASISSDTTTNGLNRLPVLLVDPPKILIIELGANDGLQVKPFAYIKNNLIQIIHLAQAKNITVYLSEMHVPPNFGTAFSQGFNKIFHDIAKEENVILIPFFLDKISTDPSLVQTDGLHPKARAQPIIMESIYAAIKKDLNL